MLDKWFQNWDLGWGSEGCDPISSRCFSEIQPLNRIWRSQAPNPPPWARPNEFVTLQNWFSLILNGSLLLHYEQLKAVITYFPQLHHILKATEVEVLYHSFIFLSSLILILSRALPLHLTFCWIRGEYVFHCQFWRCSAIRIKTT